MRSKRRGRWCITAFSNNRMTSATIAHQPKPNSEYSGDENLEVMGAMNNYNQWIYDTIAPYLGRRILEAGCGNGNITRYILQRSGIERYVGVDLSSAFCRSLEQSAWPQAPGTCVFKALDLQDPGLVDLAQPPFDSIVCLNVLEHIEHDRELLERMLTMLEPGGRLILIVPAFQQLYGTIDAIDHHYRRYTRPRLTSLVQRAGFNVRCAFYFNVMGIPAWIWHGKIRKLTTHPKSEMTLWDRAVPWLQKLERWVPIPCGLSVVLIAEKS